MFQDKDLEILDICDPRRRPNDEDAYQGDKITTISSIISMANAGSFSGDDLKLETTLDVVITDA